MPYLCPDCGRYAEHHEIVDGDLVCLDQPEQLAMSPAVEALQKAQSAWVAGRKPAPPSRRRRADIDD